MKDVRPILSRASLAAAVFGFFSLAPAARAQVASTPPVSGIGGGLVLLHHALRLATDRIDHIQLHWATRRQRHQYDQCRHRRLHFGAQLRDFCLAAKRATTASPS